MSDINERWKRKIEIRSWMKVRKVCSAVQHTVYIYIFCAEKCDFYLCYDVCPTIKLIIQIISHCFALYNIVEIQAVWMIEWLNDWMGIGALKFH